MIFGSSFGKKTLGKGVVVDFWIFGFFCLEHLLNFFAVFFFGWSHIAARYFDLRRMCECFSLLVFLPAKSF